MLHEIKIDKTYHDGNLERDVHKKIMREKFFLELRDHKIKMRYLLANYKSDLNLVAKFNFFLKIVKQTHNIGIIQSLVFLDEEEYPIKDLNKLLSSENRFQLELEYSRKYKLKKIDDNTDLDDWFIA